MYGTLALEVDWDNDATFDGGIEDITQYVDGAIACSLGRDRASQLTGRAIAGSLECRLYNNDGRFSSFLTTSPLYGSIVPGRRVRLSYTYSAVTYRLWSGFLDSIIPLPSLDGAPAAVLRASGPLAWLNDPQRQASIPMSTNVATGTAVGAILDDASWPAGDRSIDAGQTTMARFWVDKQGALNALRKVEDTESGFLREGRDGKGIFEDRHHRLKTPHTVSQATYSDAAAAALPYVAIQQEDAWAEVYRRFEARIQLFTVSALAVLWTLAATGADSPFIGAGESQTFWASYPNPDSGTDAVAVDAWTTPVSATDYTANSAADGSGTDLTASVSVAVSTFANALKITLTNNHASLPAYLTLLQARGTPVVALDPVTRYAEDTAVLPVRTYPNPGEFIPTVVEGQDWCDFNLAIYKDPIPVVGIGFFGNVDDAHLVEVLSREVSDRVTVVAGSSRTQLGINEDFFIESAKYVVSPYGDIEASFELSPADAFGGFWILDLSELGTGTKLAY